jgi:ComF family protein
MWKYAGAVRTILDFVLPPRCLVCSLSTRGVSLPWVCQHCWDAVKYITQPICAQCGQPLAASPEGIGTTMHRCGVCLLSPPAYDRARAVGLYAEVLRDLIHALKYQRIYGLVRPLGDLLCQHFGMYWGTSPPEALVPVPLHHSKLRTREFDQALALARHVSEGVGIPFWADVLIRHRPTLSQVGLSAVERQRNIRGAFTVQRSHCCTDKALLLIDDVYTTGATVQECARLLRQAGAARVDVYTLARVD